MKKVDKTEAFSRILIYFPIIHTQRDMGALGEQIRRVTLQKLGKKGWKKKVKVIDEMWTKIEHVVDELALSYKKVRLYQDGIPVCGRETEIVKELAKSGSRNHRLLFRLMEKGATIIGTESAKLLLDEYELRKKILSAGDTGKASDIEAHSKALSESLLISRDRFIADRINITLGRGETGILFLGMLHSLKSHLDKDIHVNYPVNLPIDRG